MLAQNFSLLPQHSRINTAGLVKNEARRYRSVGSNSRLRFEAELHKRNMGYPGWVSHIGIF